MIHGHFGAHAHTRNTTASLGQVNGCGPIRPIHPKHSFKKPTRRELSPDQRTFNYYLSKVRLISLFNHIILSCIYFRFAFVLSMLLDYLKADFSRCLSFGSKYTHTRSIFGLSCGFDAALSFITLYCELRQGTIIGNGERNFTISGIKGRGPNTDGGKRKVRMKVRMIMMS